MLRRWRWRAADFLWGPEGTCEEPVSEVGGRAMRAAHGGVGWAAIFGARGRVLRVGGCGADSLEDLALAARRRWRRGGGRRQLEWLRRWEVDEGREADSRGRWRVARIVSVARPARRYGQQLDVQVEWAGVDTLSGSALGVGWVSVTWCTPDVQAEARRMEGEAYPAARAAPPVEGSRRKRPRLAAAAVVAAAAASDEAGSGSESEVDEEPAEEGEAMQVEVVGAVWADEWADECRDIIVSQIVAGVVQRAAAAGRVVGGWAG